MATAHRSQSSSKAADTKSAGSFAEFLNPNSMITPGAAGAFTMVITNTLCQQFALLPPNWTGLAVSFMFGAVVFGYAAGLLTRVMYFVINSLIIFVVAHGSNAIGVRIEGAETMKTASLESTSSSTRGFNLAGADKPANPPPPPPPPSDKSKFFRQW
jgi:hypothetical protein